MWTSADQYLENEKNRREEILDNLEKILDENKDNKLIVNLIELLVDEQISKSIHIDNYNNLHNSLRDLKLRTNHYDEYIKKNKSLIEKLK